MKRKWIIPVVAAACLCAGCALLPQEEQLPDAPVLRAFTGDQHTLVAVERGDIVKEEIIIGDDVTEFIIAKTYYKCMLCISHIFKNGVFGTFTRCGHIFRKEFTVVKLGEKLTRNHKNAYFTVAEFNITGF